MRTDSLRVSDEALTARPRPDPGASTATATCPPSRTGTPPASRPRRPTRRSGRPTWPAPRDDPRPALARPVQALSADLPPVRRQPDDPGRLRGHQRRRSPRARASSRPRARSSSSTATAASCPRPASRRTRSCRRSTVGQALDLHALEPDPALHPAAAALHRGDADQGAREGGHRPAEHLRADHPDDPGPRSTSSRRSGGSSRPTWG